MNNAEILNATNTCARDLRRLEALEHRYRLRAIIMRGLRATLGFLIAMGVLFKFKIAATISGKLAIALLVALGFAWPAFALAFLGISIIILFFVAAIFGQDAVPPPDCPNCADCIEKNKRREQLKKLIEQRRQWLAAPALPAPRRPSHRRRIKIKD